MATNLNKEEFMTTPAYQQSKEQVIQSLGVDENNGLSTREAQSRLDQFGPNKLKEEEKTPFLQRLLAQFKDFMIIILIIASLISALMGRVADAGIIIAIVVINAILGIYQEGKAEEAVAALQKIAAPAARVLRNGKQQMLPTDQIVIGDIVLLEAGDVVPADIRLLHTSNLKAEEASLTGESVPVDKDAGMETRKTLGIGDRENMVFSSTSITYGNGVGIVTATGHDTEVGFIADSLSSIQTEATPLQVSLNHLGKVLGILCIIVCLVVFVVGLFQGGNAFQLFMTSVSLAVAAIPEGLPAVVTIVLSLGMNKMAEENAIVKRLLAVETLGSIDVICSDKTGTLTQNEMTVMQIYAGESDFEVTGSGYAPRGEIVPLDANADQGALTRLLEVAALCNEAELYEEKGHWDILGDPTEGALLTMAGKRGVTRSGLQELYQYEGSFPFDSRRKAMSVFYSGMSVGNVSLTKGAPDILIQKCQAEFVNGEVIPLSETRKEEILRKNSEMASRALRVLAYAYKVHPDQDFHGAEEDMIFLGLTGMIDPPREEVKDSIKICKNAGIRVVMITGDYAETALAIAKELGIAGSEDRVITGYELDHMSPEELRHAVEDTSVFARVSPENKVDIISALKANDHAASMTGDGVNDAPALKMADIGVAMGITGTEVSKSAADMILTDDNFSTIVSAVEQGRIIYSNIQKFVLFLLSCNVGEILVVFLTNLILGAEYTPMMPIQLLWLNLVTDSFPALALGQEQGESDVMQLPPRDKHDNIINKHMIQAILVQAVAIFIAVFVAFQLGRYFYPDFLMENGEIVVNAAGEAEIIDDFIFTAHPHATPSNGARTMAFFTLVAAELIRAFSCRSAHQSVFSLGIASNATMNKSVLFSLGLTLVVLYLPFLNGLFYTVPLNLRDLGICFGLALIPFTLGEVYKAVKYKK